MKTKRTTPKIKRQAPSGEWVVTAHESGVVRQKRLDAYLKGTKASFALVVARASVLEQKADGALVGPVRRSYRVVVDSVVAQLEAPRSRSPKYRHDAS